MITYYDLKMEKQKIFNDFSNDNIYWIFAFSQKEFEQELEKRNLKKDELVSIGAGGFMKKSAIEGYKKVLNEMDDITETIKADDRLLTEGLKVELANHEYCITYDAEPALDVFHLRFEEVEKDQRLKRILKEAINQYLKEVEAWYWLPF